MTDPFDALRLPRASVAPDPGFAAELRARIERALLRGGTMTETTVTPALGDVGYASLWLPDAERAAEFYGAVLGWQLTAGSDPGEKFVPGLNPPLGIWPTGETNTMYLAHAVDDTPEAVRRVRAAGGRATDPEDRPYGLMSECVDNQGMRFAIFQAPRSRRAVLPEAGLGGLAYLTVEVPESALFREFYGAVFGWTFTPGRVNDGWGVNEVRPMMGLHGGAERCAVLPMYRVADIAATVAAVRSRGGTAADPAQRPYGLESLCADDQGSRFYLGQL